MILWNLINIWIKICKEIFNSEKGVTTYIDTMKEVNDGNRYVPYGIKRYIS